MARSNLKDIIRRPFSQNFVVGILLFCLPGIYTALTGLGAGGGRSSSADVANQTNAILYGLLALVGLFGGSILNILRPKLSLMVGAIGYPIYVGGLWYYDRTGHSWFPLLSGAILGLTGGFLWTAAAYVQFTYAEEKDKALFISIQWSLRSFGAIIGSAISLSLNINETKPIGVSNAVYVVFVVIHSSAFFIAMFLITHPSKVIRKDGTHIALFKKAKFWTEMKETAKIMADYRYLLLVPAQIVCEMALGLMSSVNARYFNLRTRSVNNMAYQSVQLFVPILLICILDSRHIKSRQSRGLLGIGLMGLVAVGASVGLISWLQVDHPDSSSKGSFDWTSSGWAGILICFILFGAIHSGYQMCVEYTLSSITNDPSTLARVAGIFKFYSALGMMISFLLAGERVPFLGQVILQLVLYIFGTAGVGWVLARHVKDSNYFTEADVIAPAAVEQREHLSQECENETSGQDSPKLV